MLMAAATSAGDQGMRGEGTFAEKPLVYFF